MLVFVSYRLQSQISHLVDTVMRLEHSNQALWRRIDVLGCPSTENSLQNTGDSYHMDSTCPSPGDLKAQPRAPILRESSDIISEGHTPYLYCTKDLNSPVSLPLSRVSCTETGCNHNVPMVYISKSAAQPQISHESSTLTIEDAVR